MLKSLYQINFSFCRLYLVCLAFPIFSISISELQYMQLCDLHCTSLAAKYFGMSAFHERYHKNTIFKKVENKQDEESQVKILISLITH